MGWMLGGVVLLVGLLVAWLIVRHPIRQVVEEVHADRARALFHRDREWLEARFLTALGKS